MFQIGGLVVFCGLLALPLPVDLAPNSTNLVGELTNALKNGLQSGGVLNTIKNLPLLAPLETDENPSDGPVGKLLQNVLNPLKDITGIEITRPKLLEIDLTPGKDGDRLILNIPLGFDVNLQVPIVKVRLLKLSVKLNVTIEVFPKKDKDGVHLVLGDCSQAPVNLKISLLNGIQTSLIQRLINKVTDTLSKTISKVVLGEVCTIVNGVLSQLDVSFVQNIVNEVIPQMNATINL